MRLRGYLALALTLIVVGFIAAFSIGRPFFVVGVTLMLLGPVRHRPMLFWPWLVGVVTWQLVGLLVGPFYCSTTMTVGSGTSSDGSPSETVCRNLVGTLWTGTGGQDPARDAANQAAVLSAAVAIVAAGVTLAALAMKHRGPNISPNAALPAIVASGIGLAVDLSYVVIVAGQQTDLEGRHIVVALYITAMSALCTAGALMGRRPHGIDQALRVAGGAGLLFIGVLGLASIGAPLLLAGVLAIFTSDAERVTGRMVAAAAGFSAAPLVIGFALT